MQKWEYLFIHVSSITEKIASMNFANIPTDQQETAMPFILQKGREGWELVSERGGFLSFKRPLD